MPTGMPYSRYYYVVPINYFYRNSTVFALSAEGTKIKMMRKNPEICFQVDDIKSISSAGKVLLPGKV